VPGIKHQKTAPCFKVICEGLGYILLQVHHGYCLSNTGKMIVIGSLWCAQDINKGWSFVAQILLSCSRCSYSIYVLFDISLKLIYTQLHQNPWANAGILESVYWEEPVFGRL
jgi:hypothetical protein